SPALTLAVTLVAGCQNGTHSGSNSAALQVVQQTANTASASLSASDHCGLTAYPASRSNHEILTDVPRDPKSRYGDMFAKLAIDESGKITHLRVLRLAHPSAPNWKEINETALNSIRRFHYKPTIYEGKPVAVCSDVSVIVDLF